MKVVAYVGSFRSETSSTLKIVNTIIESLKIDKRLEIESKIYSADKLNLIECKGCCNCFFTGKCKLDKIDDGENFKNDLLEADLIILASPVFLHHITSNTKKVVDRISYWSHIFRLIGKKGIVVSTSSTNGNEYVDFYLSKVLNYCGVDVIENISLPLSLMTDEMIEEYMNNKNTRIISNLLNKDSVKITSTQEFLFRTLKDVYSKSSIEKAEYKYWNDNGYFKFDTYKELREGYTKKII